MWSRAIAHIWCIIAGRPVAQVDVLELLAQGITAPTIHPLGTLVERANKIHSYRSHPSWAPPPQRQTPGKVIPSLSQNRLRHMGPTNSAFSHVWFPCAKRRERMCQRPSIRAAGEKHMHRTKSEQRGAVSGLPGRACWWSWKFFLAPMYKDGPISRILVTKASECIGIVLLCELHFPLTDDPCTSKSSHTHTFAKKHYHTMSSETFFFTYVSEK